MKHILPSLVGSWALSRTIDNGCSMIGTATIARRCGGQFDYREQGGLTLPDGRTVEAERRYLFAPEDAGFTVLFAETPPRLFHRVALEKLGPNLVGIGVHLCADDCYESHYEFRADGAFTVEHRVRGPRKRYAISSRYSRMAITASPA